jgi:hypothetical protein
MSLLQPAGLVFLLKELERGTGTKYLVVVYETRNTGKYVYGRHIRLV